MFQGEHSAILSTFIKLPFVIKIFALFIFEWSFYTGFTVYWNVMILALMSLDVARMSPTKLWYNLIYSFSNVI